MGRLLPRPAEDVAADLVILLPHFTRALLFRSVAAWLLVRLCVAGISVVAAALARRPPPEDPFLRTPRTALLGLAAGVAAGLVFARSRNEDLFLASLGYGRARLVALLAAPPLLLEVAMRIAVNR